MNRRDFLALMSASSAGLDVYLGELAPREPSE